MSKFSLKEKDLGWKRISKSILDSKKYVVLVGVQDAGEKDDEGTYIAEYAFYNEFGTDTIPERSFIRSNMDSNRKEYQKLKAKFWNAIIDGNYDIVKALKILGEKVQSDIQMNITAIDDPPNSEITIERKGSSNPLIDEGTMRRSIRHVVARKSEADKLKVI